MADTLPATGGIVMADAPTMPTIEEMPVVMPESTVPDVVQSASTVPIEPPPFSPPPPPTQPTPVPVNPFIPAGVLPQSKSSGVGVPAKPSGSGQLPRRILMLVVFLALLAGIIIVGRFVLNLFTGTKDVNLTYWGLWENEAMVQSVINDFQVKNPKIKITYIKQSPRQYRERLSAAISRGDGPDLFRFHNTWMPMLKNELSQAPKTAITASEFSEIYYPVTQADLVSDQSVYGIPLMIDGLGLYYNEDLFSAAGITGPPTTWEELLSMVPKIAKPDGAGFAVSAIALGTANNVEHFSDILTLMMFQNGASPADLTSPAAEEALVFYRKFATASDPIYTWNQTLDNSIYAFASGRVAMILAPSWRVFDIKQINPSLRFKIAPVPQLPGGAVAWASYWAEGVSVKSKNQEVAWEFLKFLSSRESVIKLYTEASKTRLFGEPYARLDLAETLKTDPYVGAYISQASNAKSFPLSSRTFDNGLNDKLIKYLEDAVNSVDSGAAPSAALRTASAGFNQVFGTYGIVVQPAASP